MRLYAVCLVWCFAAPHLHAQWLNFRTPGVPRTTAGNVNLVAPTPKAPDGRSDLSGVWESRNQYFNDLAKDLPPGELVCCRRLENFRSSVKRDWAIQLDVGTLVVDTTGFNGREWLDTAKGHPQTESAHVTERFTRRDFGHMEIDITIADPGAYEKPWRTNVPFHLLADTDLIETYSERARSGAQRQVAYPNITCRPKAPGPNTRWRRRP
jgi:hypothetical protein